MDHERGTGFVVGDEDAYEFDRAHHRPGQGHRGYNKAGELDHERGTGSRRTLACCAEGVWIHFCVLSRSSMSLNASTVSVDGKRRFTVGAEDSSSDARPNTLSPISAHHQQSSLTLASIHP